MYFENILLIKTEAEIITFNNSSKIFSQHRSNNHKVLVQMVSHRIKIIMKIKSVINNISY